MFKGFDKYTINARILPALFVLIPLGLAFDLWYDWDNIPFGILFTTLGSTIFLSMISHIVRDPGKQLEKKLFTKWGGLPSAQVLSYKQGIFDHTTLQRYHSYLAKAIPMDGLPRSEAEEAAKYGESFQLYTSASNWLRKMIWDREKYRMVYVECTSYGYRRNLVGIKGWGVLTWTIGTLAYALRAASPYIGRGLPEETSIPAIVFTVLGIIVLFFWARVLTHDWIKKAAFTYAKKLVESVDLIAREKQ